MGFEDEFTNAGFTQSNPQQQNNSNQNNSNGNSYGNNSNNNPAPSSNYSNNNQNNNNSSYNKPAYNNGGNGGGYKSGGGGFNKGGGGGFNKFQPKQPEGPAEWYLPYVVTGNREVPQEAVERISRIIKQLESLGYTMRSGGMEGLESAVENVVSKKEIHIPWKGFNDKESKFTFTPDHARELAAKHQPGYEGLKPVIQTFLAKNVRMIMGKDLKSPAMFMIVWTDDGVETVRDRTPKTGNVGHAIAVASSIRMPVFNFSRNDAESRLKQFLGINNE